MREILAPSIAALFFLTQLFFAIRLLTQADVIFGSSVRVQDIGLVFVYLLPSIIAYVFPMAFLLGILIGLGRLSEDRELTALWATGASPRLLLGMPLLLGAAFALIMLAITTYLEPHGLKRARSLVNSVIKSNLVGDIREETFYEDLGFTIYASKIDKGNGGLVNVLISNNRNSSSDLMLAREGKIDTTGSASSILLRLKDGEIHHRVDADDYVVASFKDASMSVEVEQEIWRKNRVRRPMEHHTPSEILTDAKYWESKGVDVSDRMVEYHRRFAHPFVMISFALAGIAIAYSGTIEKQGSRKTLAFIWTLGALIAYFVLGKIFTTLGTGHLLSSFMAAWLPVLLIMVFSILVFWLRAK